MRSRRRSSSRRSSARSRRGSRSPRGTSRRYTTRSRSRASSSRVRAASQAIISRSLNGLDRTLEGTDPWGGVTSFLLGRGLVAGDPVSGPQQTTLFGHPTGLYALFFAEMWERFSYYGMRALLVFYMIKGFLAYGDTEAYRVYGAYTALVYMTPFIGGMVADRLLGARIAVVLGGLLMAAGHLLMTIEASASFYVALALLIVGNGFFKPNISTIVGTLYPEGSPARDGGFTIFYMGINLGAAMAPLLCGYVGETYGWHYGFGLATGGMLVGLAVFVVPTLLARVLILGGALTTAVSMVFLQDNWLLLAVNGSVAVALALSGAVSFVALGREGLPPEAGGPP
ncbi:MAG TPA: MFS transporter, partial [Deltaproteobacteria bacterium]|nr:MFS transporter [Deltaproteobacteria bacterium]